MKLPELFCTVIRTTLIYLSFWGKISSLCSKIPLWAPKTRVKPKNLPFTSPYPHRGRVCRWNQLKGAGMCGRGLELIWRGGALCGGRLKLRGWKWVTLLTAGLTAATTRKVTAAGSNGEPQMRRAQEVFLPFPVYVHCGFPPFLSLATQNQYPLRLALRSTSD